MIIWSKHTIYKRILDNIISLMKNWEGGIRTDTAIVEAYHATYEDTDSSILYEHIQYLIEDQRLVKKGTVISLPHKRLENEFSSEDNAILPS